MGITFTASKEKRAKFMKKNLLYSIKREMIVLPKSMKGMELDLKWRHLCHLYNVRDIVLDLNAETLCLLDLLSNSVKTLQKNTKGNRLSIHLNGRRVSAMNAMRKIQDLITCLI